MPPVTTRKRLPARGDGILWGFKDEMGKVSVLKADHTARQTGRCPRREQGAMEQAERTEPAADSIGAVGDVSTGVKAQRFPEDASGWRRSLWAGGPECPMVSPHTAVLCEPPEEGTGRLASRD